VTGKLSGLNLSVPLVATDPSSSLLAVVMDVAADTDAETTLLLLGELTAVLLLLVLLVDRFEIPTRKPRKTVLVVPIDANGGTLREDNNLIIILSLLG
jgi:hypothetical protein